MRQIWDFMHEHYANRWNVKGVLKSKTSSMNQEREFNVPDGSWLILKQMFSDTRIKCILYSISSFLHAKGFKSFLINLHSQLSTFKSVISSPCTHTQWALIFPNASTEKVLGRGQSFESFIQCMCGVLQIFILFCFCSTFIVCFNWRSSNTATASFSWAPAIKSLYFIQRWNILIGKLVCIPVLALSLWMHSLLHYQWSSCRICSSF